MAESAFGGLQFAEKDIILLLELESVLDLSLIHM